jgi:hypothetical protein
LASVVLDVADQGKRNDELDVKDREIIKMIVGWLFAKDYQSALVLCSESNECLRRKANIDVWVNYRWWAIL